MRRLVAEIPLQELVKFEGGDSQLLKIKLLEVLHFLRYDRTEFAMILRVQFKSPKDRFNAANFKRDGFEMQLLEEREGTYTCFCRCKPIKDFPDLGFFSSQGYFTTPFEIIDEKLKVTFVGNVPEMKRFLETIERAGVRHKVVSISDARFSLDSPLSRLTDRQRRVLNTAYDLGYYDRPRRISSKKLAKQLNLASSTLVSHRLKAERNLIAAVLQRE